MGFSWTSLSIGDLIKAAHSNQVKTNLDSLYDDLQLSHHNFLYLPVSIGDKIKRDQYNEMRAATDYADDKNYCRAHKATNYATYRNSENTTYRNDHHKTVLTSEKSGYDATYRATVYSGADATVKGTADTGYRSGDNGSYYTSNNGEIKSNYDLSHI